MMRISILLTVYQCSTVRYTKRLNLLKYSFTFLFLALKLINHHFAIGIKLQFNVYGLLHSNFVLRDYDSIVSCAFYYHSNKKGWL